MRLNNNFNFLLGWIKYYVMLSYVMLRSVRTEPLLKVGEKKKFSSTWHLHAGGKPICVSTHLSEVSPVLPLNEMRGKKEGSLNSRILQVCTSINHPSFKVTFSEAFLFLITRKWTPDERTPSFKTTFSEAFLLITPCKWTLMREHPSFKTTFSEAFFLIIPRVSFQCRLSYSVRTPLCAVTCTSIC